MVKKIVLSILFLLLVAKPALAVYSPDVKRTPAIPFVMSDFDNLDWRTLHPEWGPVGGWWDGEGWGYNFTIWRDKAIAYLDKSKDYTITLDDGTQIPKPVGIGVRFTNYGPSKLNAVKDFVTKASQEFDDNPNYPNLKFLVIGSCSQFGEFDEANTCDNLVAMTVVPLFRAAFKKLPTFVQGFQWNLDDFSKSYATDAYANKNAGVKCNGWQLDIPNACVWTDEVLTGACMGFAEVYHEQIPVGFEPQIGFDKCTSYWGLMEALSHHPDFLDLQGSVLTGMAEAESAYQIPILRFTRDHLQKTIDNTPDTWTVLRQTNISSIHYQDDTQGPSCTVCNYGEAPDPSCTTPGKPCRHPRYCFPKNSQNQIECSGPWKDNFNYWLYSREDLPGSRPVVLRTADFGAGCVWSVPEIPSPAKEHPYARYTVKRTDQDTGNRYMSFDIDDRFIKPVKKVYEVVVTFVNQGTDTLSLKYTNTAGITVTKTIIKGPVLGTVNGWVDYSWIVTDANFANQFGGADFQIDCNNDGDEYIHRVFVKSRPTSYDLNNDGKINETDLNLLKGSWNNPYNETDLSILLSAWQP